MCSANLRILLYKSCLCEQSHWRQGIWEISNTFKLAVKFHKKRKLSYTTIISLQHSSSLFYFIFCFCHFLYFILSSKAANFNFPFTRLSAVGFDLHVHTFRWMGHTWLRLLWRMRRTTKNFVVVACGQFSQCSQSIRKIWRCGWCICRCAQLWKKEQI